MYKLDYTDEAKLDMQRLKRDEPKAFQKLGKLLGELMEHPRTGTGKPEQLKGDRAGQCSRPTSQGSTAWCTKSAIPRSSYSFSLPTVITTTNSAFSPATTDHIPCTG